MDRYFYSAFLLWALKALYITCLIHTSNVLFVFFMLFLHKCFVTHTRIHTPVDSWKSNLGLDSCPLIFSTQTGLATNLPNSRWPALPPRGKQMQQYMPIESRALYYRESSTYPGHFSSSLTNIRIKGHIKLVISSLT